MEDEEENEVPDDETVNQMLARSEGEFELYQRMDIERRREEARQGAARKPRLMEETELPEWMSKDEEEVERLTCEEEEERFFGRGNRQKKDVDYSDSLTEKEWLKAIGAMEEEGNVQDDDDEDEPGPSGGRGAKRGRPAAGGSSVRRKRQRGDGDGGEEEEEPTSKKRRGGPGRSLNFHDKDSGVNPQLKRKMKKILELVMKYSDAEGRILSQPFMKLPTRKELPDYYEVIKKPLDINKILQRLQADKYMVNYLFSGSFPSFLIANVFVRNWTNWREISCCCARTRRITTKSLRSFTKTLWSSSPCLPTLASEWRRSRKSLHRNSRRNSSSSNRKTKAMKKTTLSPVNRTTIRTRRCLRLQSK